MSLFGIPLCIPYEYYVEFINTNFPTLLLSEDTIYTTFIIANIGYIILIYFFCKILFKFIMKVKEVVF